MGDPFRIKQFITNLVTNAVKFTDHGYVLVRTKVEQETDKDYTLCITITDTGLGISTEDQSKLFTAFNQADTSITRRYGGSGLGLVICKKLCEEMHGRITFTSELNKGSSFTAHVKVEKLVAYEIEKTKYTLLPISKCCVLTIIPYTWKLCAMAWVIGEYNASR